MNAPTIHALRRAALLAVAAALSSSPARATDPPPAASSMQTLPAHELREKMAVLHERMAACLRSDRRIEECRSEMMQGCREAVGAHGCRMMGMGHGMHHEHMQPSPPASTPE